MLPQNSSADRFRFLNGILLCPVKESSSLFVLSFQLSIQLFRAVHTQRVTGLMTTLQSPSELELVFPAGVYSLVFETCGGCS